MRHLPGTDLDQYRTQAKDLLKQVRAEDSEAVHRLQHHPDHLAPGRVRLADTQLVLAREFNFPSWAKFKEYVLFRSAVQALDPGDLPGNE